jgi:hypothetical protein
LTYLRKVIRKRATGRLTSQQLYNCAWIVYGVLMILIKANILLQYIRIFVPDNTRSFTSIASYTLIILNTVFYITFVFLLIFSCVPRRKIWDPTVQGHCLDWRIVLATGNIITFVSDVIIWVVPQRVIWRLHLDKSRKWGLSALFTIGIFAIICSGVRIHFQVQLLKSTNDISYVGSKICFWGTCQVTAGFLVACLPSMPLLWNNIKKQTWAEKMGSGVRTLLRRSKNSSGFESEHKMEVTTIGGGGGRRYPKGNGRRAATDVEFDELVQRTDSSITSEETGNTEDAHSFSRVSEQTV